MRKRFNILTFLFAFLFLAPNLCAQATFDAFGGLITDSGGNTVALCTTPPDKQSATCSRSGTTVTCTVTDGTKYAVNEPILIQGTGTGEDWTYDGTDPQAGASLITAIATNTVTLTSHTSGTVAATAGTFTPARVYTNIVNSAQRFCTPGFNHQFFWIPIGGAEIPTPAIVTAKYSGNNCTAVIKEYAQFLTWNFSGVGMASFPYDPTGNNTCGANLVPKFLTFEEEFWAAHATDNLNGYLLQPIKDIEYGMDAHNVCGVKRPLFDSFSNTGNTANGDYYTFALAEMNGLGDATARKSPFLVGLTANDEGNVATGAGSTGDFHTYIAGRNDCDSPPQIAIASPHQTYSNKFNYGSNNPYIYPDSAVYSKTLSASAPGTCSIASPCSWPDFVRNKYTTVAAMNTAWGSSYTTFGSSETAVTGEAFGTGTGAQTVFNYTFAHTGVTPNTVQVLVVGLDKGGDCPQFQPSCSGAAGTGLLASHDTTISSGSITYSSGVARIIFTTAPANGAAITVNYTFGGWNAGGTGLEDENGANAWTGASSDGTYRCLLIPANYATSTHYNVADIVFDATSDTWQYATTAGTTGGARPGFSVTAGVQTVDGGETWDSEGPPVCGTGGDFPASTANQTWAADARAWLAQYGAASLKAERTAIKTFAPDLLYFGPDLCGAYYIPCRIPFMQAENVYADVMHGNLNESGILANNADTYQYTTKYISLPLFSYENLASVQGDIPCAVGTIGAECFSTQQTRGQSWYNRVNFILNATNASGVKQIAGLYWWFSQTDQGIDWGLKTATKDNAYDGHEDVSTSVSCSAPNGTLTCGSESGAANFLGLDGIFCVHCVRDGNALWFQA
ncbi:MAG: hypothetical protein ACRD4H_01555, partial [Candidatus Acidiferrales bacterium]